MKARFLEPATLERLRALAAAQDPDAVTALRHWNHARRAPARSPLKRACRRSFERAALRALGEEQP